MKKKNNISKFLSYTTEKKTFISTKLTFSVSIIAFISFKISPLGDHLKNKIYY